jgi:hypothetical protein
MEELDLNQKLKTLITAGKDCGKIEDYKQHYVRITKKKYTAGCNKCACNFLFFFLSSYIKNMKI